MIISFSEMIGVLFTFLIRTGDSPIQTDFLGRLEGRFIEKVLLLLSLVVIVGF
jgi:hypothetical protein